MEVINKYIYILSKIKSKMVLNNLVFKPTGRKLSLIIGYKNMETLHHNFSELRDSIFKPYWLVNAVSFRHLNMWRY